MRRFICACGLILPTLIGCQALDEPPMVRNGPYVGVLAGGVIENFDLPSNFDSESTYTYGARAGYRFLRYAAVEVAVEDLGEVDIRQRSPRMDVGDVDFTIFSANLKGYTNDDPLQAYGLVGIGVIDADIENSGATLAKDETETLYRFGVGLEAHSGKHWTFYAEGTWNIPDGWADDYEFFSLIGGLNYRF